jgi:FtsP/CotA-like multicopper oxidase with cupredoxin domain
MHSHVCMQEQVLMTAPLIVEDEMALREDRQEIVLMLHDFTFRSPEEVLAGLTGSVHAVSAQHAAMTGMKNMGTMNMVGRDAPVMQMPVAGAPHMGLNDVDFDAFLANDRTLTDPEVVRVERGGRVRLRIINGASSSQFWIDLGALTGKVVAVDGHSVRPAAGQRFPIAMAQRLDLLIDLPRSGAFPVLAQLEGTPRRTGIILAVRDTVLVMPNAARVRIAFDADNPGRWAFHCHNLYHMQTGMLTEVRYDGIAV